MVLLSLMFLRLGMTQSVSTDDAPLSVSVPLPAPLISVKLLLLSSAIFAGSYLVFEYDL